MITILKSPTPDFPARLAVTLAMRTTRLNPYYIENFSADCSSFSHFGSPEGVRQSPDTDSWAIEFLVFCVCDLLTQAEFVVGFKLGVKSNGDKVSMRVIHTNKCTNHDDNGKGPTFFGFQFSDFNLKPSVWFIHS